ncbi:MAG: hypothetical protein V1915_03750 [Candidatus Bathyarchaeota archaeon]
MLLMEREKEWETQNQVVKDWLSRLEPKTADQYRRKAYKYFMWVQENGGAFAHKSAEDLLDLQVNASGRAQYNQVKLLVHYITLNIKGAVSSKAHFYSAIRSIYEHNYAPLPRDANFRIHGETPPVEGELTVEGLRKIVLAANRCYRAVFLCMFQSGMGVGEFTAFNRMWDRIGPQLKKERTRVDLSGRKHAKNREPFYTFLGRDAIVALKEYLEKDRGPIKAGEAIFLNQHGNPLNGSNIGDQFLECAIRGGLTQEKTIPCTVCGGKTLKHRKPFNKESKALKVFYRCLDCGNETWASDDQRVSRSVRYGTNPHEMRDLFRSEWDTSTAKGVCAEFFMGHDIDPNDYNKVMKMHPDWAEEQYALAEPFLNILTQDPRKVPLNEITELRKKNLDLERELETLKTKNLEMEEDSKEKYGHLEDVFNKTVDTLLARMKRLEAFYEDTVNTPKSALLEPEDTR